MRTAGSRPRRRKPRRRGGREERRRWSATEAERGHGGEGHGRAVKGGDRDKNGGRRRGRWGMMSRCHGENGRGRWWSTTASTTRTGRRKEGQGRWAVLVERTGREGRQGGGVDDEGRRGRSRAAAEEIGRGGRKEKRWSVVDPAMAAVLATEKEAVAEREWWRSRSRRGGSQSQRGGAAKCKPTVEEEKGEREYLFLDTPHISYSLTSNSQRPPK